MKPFDLERAKAGDPVITRDGQPARIVCFDRKSTRGHSLTVLRSDRPEEEYAVHYPPSGKYGGQNAHAFDLVLAPKKKTLWFNLYKAAEVCFSGTSFHTKGEAEAASAGNAHYITTYSVEIEE